MNLLTIYNSPFLCYLPLLSPDITLSTLLSVSPQYTVLHSCVTFLFWPQISLSAPYYESPHNIKFFNPLLPSAFGHSYHSQHPIIRLPTIYNSTHLCYFPLLAPDINLSTLLSVSPQYTVHHSWLPSLFGPRYHSPNPIMSLRTIYSSSPLCYLPLLDPDITLSTL